MNPQRTLATNYRFFEYSGLFYTKRHTKRTKAYSDYAIGSIQVGVRPQTNGTWLIDRSLA